MQRMFAGHASQAPAGRSTTTPTGRARSARRRTTYCLRGVRRLPKDREVPQKHQN